MFVFEGNEGFTNKMTDIECWGIVFGKFLTKTNLNIIKGLNLVLDFKFTRIISIRTLVVAHVFLHENLSLLADSFDFGKVETK